MKEALPGWARRVVWTACAFATLFVVTSVGGDIMTGLTGHDNVLGLIPALDLRVEGNIPTFFSGLLLFGCGTVAAAVARTRQRQGLHQWHRHWQALALIFAALAVDEAAGLHELMNAPLRDAFSTTGVLFFPWVLLYGLFVLVFARVYWRFLLAFVPWYRVRIAASGVLFVSGALGMEMVQGSYYSAHGPDPTYLLIWLTGETLELVGALLFGYTLLKYLVTLRATAS
ncbi:MAG: hypothetical protein LC632_03575 [Xanthomonadaceae bacterium]|nr:hypothetical protein [Xanthomonadaceae bacterium]